MTLTERDVRILRDLDRCGALLTTTIRDEYFPGDKTGRKTRRRLGELKHAGLIDGRLVIVGERFEESASGSWALKKAGRKLLEVQDDPSMVS
jgi:hypothetical protein